MSSLGKGTCGSGSISKVLVIDKSSAFDFVSNEVYWATACRVFSKLFSLWCRKPGTTHFCVVSLQLKVKERIFRFLLAKRYASIQ